MNRKVNRNYIIIGLCMILVVMGVGYAAFSTSLKINGTANIDSNFSVKITDIKSTVQSGSASDAETPTHTDTMATFKTNLVLPRDAMKYDITVENQGNIDAVLESIDVNTGNNSAIKFVTSGINQGDKLQMSQSDVLTVIVSYNNSVTSQPENTESTITVTLNYKQDDGTVISPTYITPDDLKALAVTEGDGLYKDEYEEGRHIYKGADPSNYITFNNELWRILSIENDGTVKIVRDDLLESMVWDSTSSNNWARPADLNTYLNETYLNTLLENDKIVSHNFGIGSVNYQSTDLAGQINDEK